MISGERPNFGVMVRANTQQNTDSSNSAARTIGLTHSGFMSFEVVVDLFRFEFLAPRESCMICAYRASTT